MRTQGARRRRNHALISRVVVCLAIIALPAGLSVDGHESSQAPNPLSLFVDVNYHASPPTGDPPIRQNFLGLCNGDTGSTDAAGSQNLHPNDSGAFDEIWSVSTPVIRVVGSVTATSFFANLNCQNGGAGSISASGNIRAYVGTWTFTKNGQAYGGAVDITRRCFLANAGGPYEINYGDDLQLNGGQSDACGGAATEGIYEWFIDDEPCTACNGEAAPFLTSLELFLSATSETPTREPYSVVLRFTDPDGWQTISSTTLAIYHNRPQAVLIVAPNPAACQQPVSFIGEASFHLDPRHHIVSYIWQFGDGSPQVSGMNVTHTYARPGYKNISLIVIDEQGISAVGGTYESCADDGCVPVVFSVHVRSNRPPFTDEQLVEAVTMKALHVTELRARIDELRATFKLGPYGYSDAVITPGVTVIRAQQIVEMRRALDEAYAFSTVIPAGYVVPSLSLVQGTVIRLAHFAELRAAVAVLECDGL